MKGNRPYTEGTLFCAWFYMAPKNSPEKQPLSKEAQKQQEIDKVLKDTRQELNPLQQFVENIKSVATNFTNILRNTFNSFFGSGSEKKTTNIDKKSDVNQNNENFDYT